MSDQQEQKSQGQVPQWQTIVNNQQENQHNGAGTAGFVLALLGLILPLLESFIFILYEICHHEYFSDWYFYGHYGQLFDTLFFIVRLVLWISGVIFSIVGFSRKPKGLAIAGLLISAVILGQLMLNVYYLWLRTYFVHY